MGLYLYELVMCNIAKFNIDLILSKHRSSIADTKTFYLQKQLMSCHVGENSVSWCMRCNFNMLNLNKFSWPKQWCFRLLKDPVLCEMSYACHVFITTHTSLYSGPWGWCFYDPKLVQLLNLQARVFIQFASIHFSVCDSSLANPKWLEFKELSLGMFVPVILRQQPSMKMQW